LGLIVAAFFLGLVLLILAHSWSQAKHFVSPLEILLGTPQAPFKPGREPIAVSEGDVTVYMPANATEQEGSLSIAVAQPDLVLVVQNVKWLVPRVAHVEFLRPDGALLPAISFSQPLEVCFTLAEDHWRAFTQDTGAYQVQYYADQQSPPAWQSLPQVTHPDRHQVCGKTDKLSMFGLAIRAQVGIPVTGITAGLAQMLLPSPIATREQRDRDTSAASAPQSVPTNAPPQVAPTDSPANQPADPPPAEPQVKEPPANPPAQDNGKKDQPPGQQKQKDPPPGQQKQDQQPKNDNPKDKKKN
jgi:hypothetical protein